jgi:Flp pilus assembly protein protease CpaA
MTLVAIAQFGAFPIVFFWLGVCVRHDLRNRTVPVALTVIPLALASLVSVWSGRWSSAGLLLFLVCISDFERFRFGLGLLGVAGALLLDPGMGMLNFSAFLVWALWDKNILGGADAKILMALIFLWGSAALLVWVAIAGGFQGGAAWWRKQREIPYTVSILIGSIAFWLVTIF